MTAVSLKLLLALTLGTTLTLGSVGASDSHTGAQQQHAHPTPSHGPQAAMAMAMRRSDTLPLSSAATAAAVSRHQPERDTLDGEKERGQEALLRAVDSSSSSSAVSIASQGTVASFVQRSASDCVDDDATVGQEVLAETCFSLVQKGWCVKSENEVRYMKQRCPSACHYCPHAANVVVLSMHGEGGGVQVAVAHPTQAPVKLEPVVTAEAALAAAAAPAPANADGTATATSNGLSGDPGTNDPVDPNSSLGDACADRDGMATELVPGAGGCLDVKIQGLCTRADVKAACSCACANDDGKAHTLAPKDQATIMMGAGAVTGASAQANQAAVEQPEMAAMEGAAEEGKKGPPMMLIIGGVVGVLVLGAAGWFFMSKGKKKAAPGEGEGEGDALNDPLAGGFDGGVSGLADEL